VFKLQESTRYCSTLAYSSGGILPAMTDGSKIQEFPDIKEKLAAPTKKSLF
jgi:hypothetical protein